MNMKKEEKIKEAYGEHYETVKNYIDDNGWCVLNVSQKEPINDFAHHEKTEWKPINERVCWRPKSLEGIENNNSWIKIESEDDLPEIGTYCHFIIKGFEELNNQGLFDGMFWDNKCAYISSVVTHYQPIDKPKSPIY